MVERIGIGIGTEIGTGIGTGIGIGTEIGTGIGIGREGGERGGGGEGERERERNTIRSSAAATHINSRSRTNTNTHTHTHTHTHKQKQANKESRKIAMEIAMALAALAEVEAVLLECESLWDKVLRLLGGTDNNSRNSGNGGDSGDGAISVVGGDNQNRGGNTDNVTTPSRSPSPSILGPVRIPCIPYIPCTPYNVTCSGIEGIEASEAILVLQGVMTRLLRVDVEAGGDDVRQLRKALGQKLAILFRGLLSLVHGSR